MDRIKNYLYFDHAASSVIFPDVNEFIYEFNNKFTANPSSIHQLGVKTSLEIEKAREKIANEFNIKPECVYFTSGGTESNNWAIFSILYKFRNSNRKQVITSEIEHPSVINPLAFYAEMFGFELIKVKTLADGRVDLEHLSKIADENVLFCSMMQVNNETGSMLQITEIGKICKSSEIIFHVDACQGFLKSKMDIIKDNISLITINSHKIHGPKGIGALVSINQELITPMILGGGHELGFRSGTLNSSGIVGFAHAIEIFKNKQNTFKQINLKQEMINQLKSFFSGFHLNGSLENSSDYILNFSISGIHSKDLFKYLNANNVYVSTSSACSSKLFKPSYVLAAMGIEEKRNFEAVRFSFSPDHTIEDLDKVIRIMKGYVKS